MDSTQVDTLNTSHNEALPKGAKIAVIGAGPAGLSCAYELLRLGYQVDIFEMDSVVGGMSRTLNILDQKVDLGPHRFFSKYEIINQTWSEMISQDECITENRLSRIFYRGKFFSYPLKGFEALFKLGFIESAHCFLSYLYSAAFPRKDPTFEAWVSNAFGKRLYEIFFKTYSEKLWGIKCTELSDLFAKQRIKSLNLMGAIKNALFSHSSNTPVTLIDQFMYPRQGCGVVYENMAAKIKEAGGQFFLQEQVVKLLTQDHKATGIVTQKAEHSQGTKTTSVKVAGIGECVTRYYDAVVSSAIFTDMLRSMEELSPQSHELADKLTFRNTILVYLAIDPSKANLCPDHWIYVHSPEIQTGRMCDSANWSTDMQNGHKEHLVCFEYWANDDEPLWMEADDKLIELAKEDAIKTGFIPANSIGEGHVHRISKSYCVYHSNYEQIMTQLIKELEVFKDLYFIGRNGSARYNNMDHSIFMGLMCARKIAGKYDGSLWDINTDSNYQECLDKHAR